MEKNTTQSEQYKALITSLLSPLLETPQALELEMSQRETSYTFTIKVYPNDVGRVIGTRGSTINAIRTILDSVSANNGDYITVLSADV